MPKTKRDNRQSASPSAREAPPAAGGPSPPARRASTYDTVRENLEAIIVAFILAIIIRHFSLEAFEIPTGSMATTLFGIHAHVDCPNCGTGIDMGLQSDSDTGKLTLTYAERVIYKGACPHCGMRHRRSAPARTGAAALAPGRETFVCENASCGKSWTGAAGDFERAEVLALADPRGAARDARLQCPMCDLRFHDVIERSNHRGGHKILVNKWSYVLGKPRRWDVIVFHFDVEKNYIKRLLALPGERAWIRGGDLWIQAPGEDEPRLQGKLENPAAREALWIPISDSDLVENGYHPVPPWREVFEGRAGIAEPVASKWWSFDASSRRWSVNALEPADRIAVLRYNRPCNDFHPYNQLSPHGRDPRVEVGDKRVRWRLLPSAAQAGGWIGGEIRDGAFTYQLRIPVGASANGRKATLRRLGVDANPDRPSPWRPPPPEHEAEIAEADVVLPLLKPSEIEFANADDRVWARVDGEEILALDYESGSPDGLASADHYLALLASGLTANLESVRVDRDIHYSYFARVHYNGVLVDRNASVLVGSAAAGGEDEYFPCGDNSQASSDGRYWGTLPERNLMGKAFVIFWPILPWRWEGGFIR